MAEERIKIPLTPERPDPKSRYLRRHSTGGVSISDMEVPIVPHYLMASTNTCHEICKYGSRPATPELGKHSTREKLVEGQSPIRKVQPVETKTVVRPKMSSDRKDQVLNTPKIIKQEVKHTILSLKKVDVAVKTKPATTLKPPMMARSCTFPLKPSRAITSTRNSDVKIVKDAGTSTEVQKKALEIPRASASLSSKPSFNRDTSLNTKQRTVKAAPPPAKNQKKERKDETEPPNNEKVIEKTLYIIEPKSEEESLKPSDNHISRSSLSSLSSLSSPALLPNEGETAKEEDKGEDKDLSQKQDFRRAKEVNLESDDNVCRRLRFSKGRVLEDNQNVQNDIEKKIFTRKEVGDGDMNNNDQTESKKVVLRRQEMEGKKDAKGLYNSVIKETANKLVEVKRSKVRALVGAFENVISLQESNKTFSHY